MTARRGDGARDPVEWVGSADGTVGYVCLRTGLRSESSRPCSAKLADDIRRAIEYAVSRALARREGKRKGR